MGQSPESLKSLIQGVMAGKNKVLAGSSDTSSLLSYTGDDAGVTKDARRNHFGSTLLGAKNKAAAFLKTLLSGE